jgi:hypothetical protein
VTTMIPKARSAPQISLDKPKTRAPTRTYLDHRIFGAYGSECYEFHATRIARIQRLEHTALNLSQLLRSARAAPLTARATSFLDSLAANFARYGTEMYLSPAQADWLLALAKNGQRRASTESGL